MKILVIEDSIRLADTIAEALQNENYQVDTAHDGLTGYEHASTGIYDMIILDLMLPKMNGYEVLFSLLQNGQNVPVLILSAKTELDDKIQGFTTGADDYMTKPFEIRELLMRIQAISRRSNHQDTSHPVVGNLSYDPATCEICNTQTGKSVQISGKEMQLLEFFMNNCNQVLEKNQITTKIWGFDSNAEYNNVEVYVSFLQPQISPLTSECNNSCDPRCRLYYGGFRMIKSLQKRISTLFIFLLTIIWLVILFLFINNSYRNNLSDLQQTVRAALHYTTWDAFVISNGQTSPSELDHIPYCLFSMTNPMKWKSCLTLSDVSDKFLLKQGKALISNNKKYIFFKRYVSVNHLRAKKGQYYVLMLSGTPALKSTLPTVFLCFILALLGIIVFTISSRALSRWMVKPIENTILSEKKFISNASHELKTPLSVISANAELLSSEVGRDNKHLLYIQQETSRMISLVQKMLTLTRLDAPQIQNTHAVFPVDDALLDIIYPMESVAFEKHIAFSIDIQEQMKMDGNESQIQNLASILLNNALSYTPEYGSIEIHAHIHNRKFYLSVENTGNPIPEEIRDRLFERFFRADEARADNGHFGLGLSIAHSIVTNHSGKITVERQGDKNVFSVMLPVTFHK